VPRKSAAHADCRPTNRHPIQCGEAAATPSAHRFKSCSAAATQLAARAASRGHAQLAEVCAVITRHKMPLRSWTIGLHFRRDMTASDLYRLLI
jgi:hypothetical protein